MRQGKAAYWLGRPAGQCFETPFTDCLIGRSPGMHVLYELVQYSSKVQFFVSDAVFVQGSAAAVQYGSASTAAGRRSATDGAGAATEQRVAGFFVRNMCTAQSDMLAHTLKVACGR